MIIINFLTLAVKRLKKTNLFIDSDASFVASRS